MPGKASISLLNFMYSLDTTFLGGNVVLYFLHENCFVVNKIKMLIELLGIGFIHK